MKKRISAFLALVLIACMFLTACGGNVNSDPKSTGNEPTTLNVLLAEEPHGLTPQYTLPVSAGVTIADCIFDTLFRWNGDTMSAECYLAETYEWVDSTHLHVTLRNDVVACNGSKITADDVLFTIEYGTAGTNSNYKRLFDLANCVVEDERNIVIALNNPYPNLTEILCRGEYGIISRAGAEAVGGVEMLARLPKAGSGKYTFEEWKEGQYVLLKANENYWNTQYAPGYDYIKFTFNTDSQARLMAVKSGDADVTFEITATQLNSLEGDSNVLTLNPRSHMMGALYLNCSRAPFNDERVREAIALLIDKDAIMQLCYSGRVDSSDTFFTPASKYYRAAETERKRDVERAKQLLAEAGYADGLTFNLYFNSPALETCELLYTQLAEGGVTLDLQCVEFATSMQIQMSGDYDSYLGSGSDLDPSKLMIRIDGRLDLVAASGGCQYKSDELASLIDLAMYDPDEAVRVKAYGDIQDYIREHNILIGLCSTLNSGAYSKAVTGIAWGAADFPDVSNCRPAN